MPILLNKKNIQGLPIAERVNYIVLVLILIHDKIYYLHSLKVFTRKNGRIFQIHQYWLTLISSGIRQSVTDGFKFYRLIYQNNPRLNPKFSN